MMWYYYSLYSILWCACTLYKHNVQCIMMRLYTSLYSVLWWVNTYVKWYDLIQWTIYTMCALNNMYNKLIQCTLYIVHHVKSTMYTMCTLYSELGTVHTDVRIWPYQPSSYTSSQMYTQKCVMHYTLLGFSVCVAQI